MNYTIAGRKIQELRPVFDRFLFPAVIVCKGIGTEKWRCLRRNAERKERGVKQWNRNLQRLASLAVTAVLCLTGCRIPAGAVAHESSVHGERNIVEEETGKGRQFRLNYRVWSDEKVSRTAEPADILLLLDTSSEMSWLADSPKENACYRPELSYAGKIDPNTVLYTEMEGNILPVSLRGSLWVTPDGTKVGERRMGTDRFTQVLYEKGSCRTRMEQMQAAVRDFLERIEAVSPESGVGLIFYGETVTSTGILKADESNIAKLMSQASVCTPQSTETRRFASALAQAADAAEKLQRRPLYVVSISSGAPDGEDDEEKEGVKKSQQAIQRIREAGGKTYSILMTETAGEDVEVFWASMASAPLDTHFLVCRKGEQGNCLDRVYQNIASVFSVSVVQELDPRFTLSQEEQERLTSAGASVSQKANSWRVVWDAELPCSQESPWTASLVIRAREDFPGGNDIRVDEEGSGIYKSGKQITEFPASSANVSLHLDMRDINGDVFLGETIQRGVGGRNVEELMMDIRTPNWYGKGQTGAFTYRWETGEGTAVGSLEQLACLAPKTSRDYCFRVAYRPASQGSSSAGKPVQDTEASARYRIRVVSGTIKVKAEGEGLTKDSSVLFRLEKEGLVLYREARAEADPQSGTLSLETEFTGLPYGTYRVIPEASPDFSILEEQRVCLLGVCGENDTVETGRRTAEARFTLSPADREFCRLFFRDGDVS